MKLNSGDIIDLNLRPGENKGTGEPQWWTIVREGSEKIHFYLHRKSKVFPVPGGTLLRCKVIFSVGGRGTAYMVTGVRRVSELDRVHTGTVSRTVTPQGPPVRRLRKEAATREAGKSPFSPSK